MAWRQFSARSIRPVLDDAFLRVGQVGAEIENFLRLFCVASARIKIRHRCRAKLRARRKSERRHESPVRRNKTLSSRDALRICYKQRLPTIGIANRGWVVDGLVPRVIGVGSRREVSELIRSVVMAEVQNSCRRKIANPCRCGTVG